MKNRTDVKSSGKTDVKADAEKITKVTLDDFFTGHTVKPISDANDVDFDKDHYLYVGENWCGYSQMGTAHFSEACQADTKDGEPRSCYGLDLAKEGGGQVAENLGLPPVSGVPALFKYDAKKGKYENIATGMRVSHQFADLFKEKEGL